MLSEDAEKAVKLLLCKKLTISTAESCTGGLTAAAITDISGASAVFNAGVVTYSNEAKIKYLGVSKETLERFGAVSRETALEMSDGVKKANGADIGVGITGIAGPTGGTDEKPVGLVYISVNEEVTENCFCGTRAEVREAAVSKALSMIIDYISNKY